MQQDVLLFQKARVQFLAPIWTSRVMKSSTMSFQLGLHQISCLLDDFFFEHKCASVCKGKGGWRNHWVSNCYLIPKRRKPTYFKPSLVRQYHVEVRSTDCQSSSYLLGVSMADVVISIFQHHRAHRLCHTHTAASNGTAVQWQSPHEHAYPGPLTRSIQQSQPALHG